ncbi:hypothetical protein Tco_0528645 [Tanacetum coccineum]
MNEDKMKKDIEEIETINIELDHRVSKLIVENEHLKQTYKQLYDSIKPTRVRSKEQCDALVNQNELRKLKGKDLVDNVVTKNTIDPEMLKIDVEPIAPRLLNNRTAHSDYLSDKVKPSTSASGSQPSSNTKKDKIQRTPRNANVQHSKLNENSELLCVKCNGCMLSDNHDLCVFYFINDANARTKSKSIKKSSKRKVWKPTGKVFTNIGYTWRPTCQTFTIVGHACPLTRITTTAEVPLRKPTALESDTPKPVVTFVYSRKPRKSKTNIPVVQIVLWYLDFGCSKLYYVEGLGHNLFSVRQFCDSNLEVNFRQHTCFIQNLEGVDLLTGSQGNNLYTLSLGVMMASAPISRHGLVRGLPKLKFEKDHLCSACEMGKNFDELTAMASEHSSSGLALHEMTPTTIMFDELLNPSLSVDHPASKVITLIAEVVAPEPAASTGSPSSTTVDQDAPSPSNLQTSPKTQTLVISNDVEEENHDLDVAHMNNDPFFCIPILEPNSKSSSADVIPTVVYTATPNSEHITKWTKDHPLDNIIGELERPVSTRLQLHEQALFCYYDAFLTSVELKNYKDSLTQACWIEAMQEKLNEFKHLEV